MNQIGTLIIAGRQVTFRTGQRVEACMPPHVSVPKPGPCPGGKRAKKLAETARKAVGGQARARADIASGKARRINQARDNVRKLAAGEGFEADPDVVAQMFDSEIGPDSPPMNLALMGVTGKGNENLFNKPLRDIPRDQMPALPDTVAGLIPLIQELGRMGVKVELIDDMDPREIKPVQTELSAPKVAKLARLMKKGWKPGGAMIISREGALGDGHHRWAGASVARMLHEQGVEGYSPVGVTALKIDLPIDELLAVMERFSGPKKSLTEKP